MLRSVKIDLYRQASQDFGVLNETKIRGSITLTRIECAVIDGATPRIKKVVDSYIRRGLLRQATNSSNSRTMYALTERGEDARNFLGSMLEYQPTLEQLEKYFQSYPLS